MIVPGVELAGVHLLMSERGVRHALGAPRAPRTRADGSRRLDFAHGTKVYISATGDGTVFRITTTDRRQRTRGAGAASQGVGVGSSRAAVLRAVPTARCDARACVTGRKRITSFALHDGRVVRVALHFAGV